MAVYSRSWTRVRSSQRKTTPLCFCVVFVVVEGALRPVSLRSPALVWASPDSDFGLQAGQLAYSARSLLSAEHAPLL